MQATRVTTVSAAPAMCVCAKKELERREAWSAKEQCKLGQLRNVRGHSELRPMRK